MVGMTVGGLVLLSVAKRVLWWVHESVQPSVQAMVGMLDVLLEKLLVDVTVKWMVDKLGCSTGRIVAVWMDAMWDQLKAHKME